MTEKEKIAGYELVLAQAEGLMEMEKEVIPTLGNISVVLRDFLPATIFSGFYLWQKEELVLGPFQGSVSCTRIALGKGVCGEAAKENKTLIIPDVTKHQNYIACDSRAKSEIVVPMYQGETLLGVLDLDSHEVASYDEIDEKYLGKLVEKIVENLNW